MANSAVADPNITVKHTKLATVFFGTIAGVLGILISGTDAAGIIIFCIPVSLLLTFNMGSEYVTRAKYFPPWGATKNGKMYIAGAYQRWYPTTRKISPESFEFAYIIAFVANAIMPLAVLVLHLQMGESYKIGIGTSYLGLLLVSRILVSRTIYEEY